jgi:hypothetical protein
VDRRLRCKNGNAKSVVTFMIREKAILTGIFLPIHRLTNFPTTGFAPCAALPKICLKKFREFPNPELGVVELSFPSFPQFANSKAKVFFPLKFFKHLFPSSMVESDEKPSLPLFSDPGMNLTK